MPTKDFLPLKATAVCTVTIDLIFLLFDRKLICFSSTTFNFFQIPLTYFAARPVVHIVDDSGVKTFVLFSLLFTFPDAWFHHQIRQQKLY